MVSNGRGQSSLELVSYGGININCYQISHTTKKIKLVTYEGWNFNSGNYLFTTDTK